MTLLFWKSLSHSQVEKQTKEESSSVRDEGVNILVNSCIRKMDRIRTRRSRKPSAARPREWWRHAVSKFRRAVSMKRDKDAILRQ